MEEADAINQKYIELKSEAEKKYNDDLESELTSNYGGLDVEINSTESYLYESLAKYIKDKDFMEKILPLFINDFPDYIDKEIEICKYALYIIDNKEQYYKWVELQESIFAFDCTINQIFSFMDELIEEKERLKNELKNESNKLERLKEKKYSIIELLKGFRKKDKTDIIWIQYGINTDKLRINEIDEMLKESKEECKDLKQQQEVEQQCQQELEKQLDKSFFDFPLNSDMAYYPYINDEYYLKVILNKLVGEEKEYRESLKELEMMKSLIPKKVKIEKEIQHNNNIEYEY